MLRQSAHSQPALLPRSTKRLSRVTFFGASMFEAPRLGTAIKRDGSLYRIISISAHRTGDSAFNRVWKFTADCTRIERLRRPGAPTPQSPAETTAAAIATLDAQFAWLRGSRKNDAAVDRMAAPIRGFGFKIPVLARSNGEVVDRHLRLKTARKLGLCE